MSLESLISSIKPLDQSAIQAARKRQKELTKPHGSLGRLEELSIQVAGITANPKPSIKHKVILTMAGDHGVVKEGVSAYPQQVTQQMVNNFLNGGAAINVLAHHIRARVVVVDMGVVSKMNSHPELVSHKIDFGTGNIAQGPAMTRKQALQSVMAGTEIVENEIYKGLDILATGDMGIGNTTPSAAIAAAITGLQVEKIAGRGTGVDDAGLKRKISAIQNALSINQPDPEDGIDVLSKVGGFEIGGLSGAILASAAHHRPVVIDGFISTAAAMIAVCLAPIVKNYLIASHTSAEYGHRLLLDWLEIEPLLNLNMRLGEGTGAALAVSLVEAACKILNEMATFEQAGVSQKEISE
jgi:nicotinate-nucleotide--dimethylbenzimidazole phosphoribosyltransferase